MKIEGLSQEVKDKVKQLLVKAPAIRKQMLSCSQSR